MDYFGSVPSVKSTYWNYNGNYYPDWSTSVTLQFPLRPIVELSLEMLQLNLTGSGSSGNPYTLVKK